MGAKFSRGTTPTTRERSGNAGGRPVRITVPTPLKKISQGYKGSVCEPEGNKNGHAMASYGGATLQVRISEEGGRSLGEGRGSSGRAGGFIVISVEGGNWNGAGSSAGSETGGGKKKNLTIRTEPRPKQQ